MGKVLQKIRAHSNLKMKEADHSSGGSTGVLWTLIHTKFIAIIEKA